jgi:hypothetical protein
MKEQLTGTCTLSQTFMPSYNEPKGTLTIGEEYSSPSISFYKNNEVGNVITIKYTKFMYKGEEVKDLQTIYDIIKSLTSIKLPSDEEINEKANSLQDEKDGDLYNEGINEGFYLGVEYMQQQILNQNKENKMETPLQNLKYYFRNNDTITKEELLTAIDELTDNELAFFINAFEHGYASSGLVAIEENKAFEAYGKLYNACNP